METVGLRERLREFLKHRQHAVKILGYTSKTLWLLLIPIAKNLVASNFDIQGWLRTYWLDLFTVLAVVAFAVFRWLFVYYEIGEKSITAHTGPFGLSCTTVCFSEISAMRVEQGVVYRSVQASTMYLETQARSLRRSEIKLVISEKNVEEIFALISSRSEGQPRFTVQPKNRLVLIYSVMFSSFFSGLAIFGTLIWQISRTFGKKPNDLADQFNSGLQKVDQQTLNLSRTVPRMIFIVVAAVVLGWMISFVNNLLDHWNFEAARRGNSQLLVRSGKYKRNRSVLNREQINYYEIRQSLFMKLARISSVRIQCSGFGRKKRDTAVLIPMTRNSETAASLRLLEPDLGRQCEQLRPSKKSFWGFVGVPFGLCFLPFIGGSAVKLFTENTHSEINYFIVLLTLPLIWYTVVQGFAHRHTAFGMTDDTCTLCCCPLFRFKKIIIPMKNVTMVQVRQSPIERAFGSCTVAVWPDCEVRKPHKVPRLSYKEVCGLLSKYVNVSFAEENQTRGGFEIEQV